MKKIFSVFLALLILGTLAPMITLILWHVPEDQELLNWLYIFLSCLSAANLSAYASMTYYKKYYTYLGLLYVLLNLLILIFNLFMACFIAAIF